MRQAWIALLWLGLSAGLAAGDEELIWREGKWVRQAKPVEGTPAGEVAIIRGDLDRGEHRAAVKHAKRFLKRYGDDPLREVVLGLAGDAELRRGRHWPAYQWYEKQLAEFPAGSGVDRALAREMEVAQAFLAGKKRRVAKVFIVSAEGEGIEILERIADLVPGTERAEVALLTIADHHYGKSKWAEASASYEGFLKLYPKSSRAAHAELRLAESLRREYRGPALDQTPLLEAEQRYKAFAAQRPAAARQARVAEILAEIHSSRAEKQYQIGRFYARTGKPAAAAFYYRLVARDYAETDWAGRAQAALAGLKRPAAPAPAGPAKAAEPGSPPPEEETQK